MAGVRGDCKDHLIPTSCLRGQCLIPYLKVLMRSASRSRTSSALCRPSSSGQGGPVALPHPVAEILDVFRYKTVKVPKQQSCYMELKVKKQILFFEKLLCTAQDWKYTIIKRSQRVFLFFVSLEAEPQLPNLYACLCNQHPMMNAYHLQTASRLQAC